MRSKIHKKRYYRDREKLNQAIWKSANISAKLCVMAMIQSAFESSLHGGSDALLTNAIRHFFTILPAGH